ncbi:hypothetical protein PVAND_006155 [Polypedilum vanderplanki]|uniref:Uncharacterized protein n=1 Tax=Polypedilum vanderplanki TaxID=319348 RepID=A0A9J6C296_POLVA|nr:hypothetical protein PVAND_006155 [Polypedilum vanderplanki]
MGKSQRNSGGSMKTTFNLNNFSNVAFCTQNRKTAVKSKHENTKKVQAVRVKRRISDNVLIAIISLITLFVAIYTAYRYALWHEQSQMNRKCNSKLRFLLIASESENLTAINHVLKQLDYEIVHDTRDHWDVQWTTAVDSFDRETKLKPQQLVIHFQQALVNNSLHYLPAFKFPEIKTDSKDGKFIIKNCLVNGTNVDNSSFVAQELIKNPLIIDGNLVEIEAISVVTSINPLRIYRPRNEFRIAFTPNFDNLTKYFCLKSMKNEKISESLAKTYRITLDDNIDEAIVATLVKSITNDRSKRLANFHQSLQLMHFRFVVDSSYKLHITDVKGFIELDSIDEEYERIIYGVLKIAGAGNIYEFSCRGSLECPMLSTMKDIVSANSCINYPCNESMCSTSECELCWPCLNQVPESLNHLHRSFREHMQRGKMRRIFPLAKHNDDRNIVNQLSPANRLSMKWFQAKCETDSTWC